MSRCTKCPTLPWLITQIIFIVCAIFLFIFILVRDDRKAKSKARTLSDIVLARLKIIVGFYQVFHGLLSFKAPTIKLFLIMIHKEVIIGTDGYKLNLNFNTISMTTIVITNPSFC